MLYRLPPTNDWRANSCQLEVLDLQEPEPYRNNRVARFLHVPMTCSTSWESLAVIEVNEYHRINSIIGAIREYRLTDNLKLGYLRISESNTVSLLFIPKMCLR